MAYSGYLIKLKGGVAENLPFEYIGLDSYSATPDQRMESKANRATTGLLHRTTVAHTATKIEFTTPVLTNSQVAALNSLISGHYTDALQRRLTIEYYDNETDTYKEADVYMPDVQYQIHRVDNDTNTIWYNPIRYAFIEY